PAPGTLQSNIVNPWGDIVSGKGYSIDVEAGKAYKITVEYASVSAIDMDAGFFLLTGDELQGNYWDVINSYWGDGHGTKLSVTGSYAVTEDGLLRILLVDWNGNNLSYTLSVEEIETIHYTELVYAKIENGTTTGTLQSGIIYPDGNVFAGKDYSIDVEGGKTYKIAVKYTSESSVCMGAGFNLLTGGDLQGDLDDFIGGNGGYSCGTELTVISHYTANEAGSVRILLVDQNGNNLSYTLSVEEIETIHYTELVYAKIENGIATGTLESGIIAPWDEIVSGKGYSIDVEEGEAYKIAVKYTSESSVCMVAGFGLLTGDELQGDLDDLIGGDMDYSCGMELTVTDYYTADEDGAIRILLYDYSGNNLNYTITVEDETAQANQFRIDHAEALGKTTATVAIADKAIVNAAITAYGALNQAVRTLLATEKTLLDALLTKITELEAAEAIEQANQLAATKFRTDHAEALGKTTATIAITDKAAVEAAITAYNELAVAVQTLLATEKALLDELLAKIAELEAAEAIEQANQLAATQFRTDHATALSKTTATVAIADKAAVEAAITAYDALNQAVQTLLATEKALLDALLAEIAELTPIIANRGNRIIGAIGVQTGSNQIILQNVPQNAKVEVYNLKGKRVYSHPAFGTPPQRGISSHDNPQILVIEVQKGIYIVKINNQALRVGVK
ncbi:MAG: T9SS type A sorting domain-containing protein, partial [Fibromonadaceae bacterium]|nr:T9SS type A sorting domain-containing protein [Fibromonadaceae bacterium]